MSEDDFPAVMAVQAICYTALTPESEESLLAKLRASPSTCFVATRDGTLAGYLFSVPWLSASPPALDAQTCTPPAQPDCLYLHDLAVAPAERHSGAAGALIRAFFTCVQELGLGRACLVAVQGSTGYWERHGFQMVPTSPSLRAKLQTYGEDVAYMERAGGM